ncbi:MAG: 3-deoxy-D-manno-octulosonic acid transferase [Bacteroidales bacterium]|jgi:3-deoxy-D-manno-octulosonic-acid transferase|nr:3-deoxy-D-manno-octulosonic acid transferase [Bacteroidales bacterium]
MRVWYSIGIWFYALAVRIAACRKHKAKLWMAGRKESFSKLQSVFAHNTQPVIWFHAASLGEFEQGRPIIEKFRQQHPDWKILLTFFSPSGYEIRKTYEHADCIVYLPIDTPKNAQKLIRLVRPKIAIFIKYEFWYNYLNELQKQGAQTYFVSTIFRPEQYFFKWYGGWFRSHLRMVEQVFVQTQESADLLRTIGLQNVTVAGDTRLDRVIEIAQTKKPYPIIEAFKGNSKLLVIGSSWPMDESLISQAIAKFPTFKFLFVPHEIDEAHLQKLEHLISQPSVRYSTVDASHLQEITHIQVMIVDQIGHLSQLYQYADIAYIGGGFGNGIHNILEPTVFEIPVLFGANYRKFQEAHDLIALGATTSITTADELIPYLTATEQQNAMYQNACLQAKNYVNSKKGATNYILSRFKN